MIYRVLLQSGSIECDDDERGEHGVDRSDGGAFVAFVPYETLTAVVDEERTTADDRSIR